MFHIFPWFSHSLQTYIIYLCYHMCNDVQAWECETSSFVVRHNLCKGCFPVMPFFYVGIRTECSEHVNSLTRIKHTYVNVPKKTHPWKTAFRACSYIARLSGILTWVRYIRPYYFIWKAISSLHGKSHLGSVSVKWEDNFPCDRKLYGTL